MKQSALAAEQFGATATAYLTSAVHARGADLQRLAVVCAGLNEAGTNGIDALDLGCGAGHAAFHMAASGARVTAYDLSSDMIAVVKAEAESRGLARLNTRQGPAEQLPFPDASFDLVATRFSAHHWSDLPAAIDEMRRVIRPDGTLVIIDAIAPEAPLLDTVIQTIEILRDASHVRDYRVSEWSSMLMAAGFATPVSDTWKLRMEFATWVARMRTPQVRIDAIRDVLDKAAEEARLHFGVAEDGSFDLDVAWLRTHVSM